MNFPEFHTQHVFIAHATKEDRMLFQEVVNDMPYLVHLSTAGDGEEAMHILNQLSELPDLIMLELDLALKNGLDCLREIKASNKFTSLPVIIFSTTAYPAIINDVYEAGSHLYIRKSGEPLNFKEIIQYVLSINWKEKILPPPRDEFVLIL